MKYGMNLLLWTGELNDGMIPVLHLLKNLGYADVIDMRGGFGSERDDSGAVVAKGWREAGLRGGPGERAGRPGRGLDRGPGAGQPMHPSIRMIR